jgi:hypothetical protein
LDGPARGSARHLRPAAQGGHRRPHLHPALAPHGRRPLRPPHRLH